MALSDPSSHTQPPLTSLPMREVFRRIRVYMHERISRVGLRLRLIVALGVSVLLAVGAATIVHLTEVSARLAQDQQTQISRHLDQVRDDVEQTRSYLDFELRRAIDPRGSIARSLREGRIAIVDWNGKDKTRRSDILKVMSPDGSILASAHWPATFGTVDPKLTKLYKSPVGATAHLVDEPTPEGSVPSLQRWAKGRVGAQDIVVAVGRFLDTGSLELLRRRAGADFLALCRLEKPLSSKMQSATTLTDDDWKKCRYVISPNLLDSLVHETPDVAEAMNRGLDDLAADENPLTKSASVKFSIRPDDIAPRLLLAPLALGQDESNPQTNHTQNKPSPYTKNNDVTNPPTNPQNNSAPNQSAPTIFPLDNSPRSQPFLEKPEKPEKVADNIYLLVGIDTSPIERIRSILVRRALLVGTLSFLFAMLLSVLLARRMTKPIEALAAAAPRLARGELSVRVVESTGGGKEVRELVDSFNRMAADLEQYQSRLVQAERVAAWQEIARGLAHELKNPLTPILSAMDILVRAHKRGRADFGDILEEQSQAVVEEVMRLKELADAFSRFARLPERKLEPLDAASLLDSIAALYTNDYPHVIVVRKYGNVPTILADKTQLGTVFTNLIKNAVEAMDGKGQLTLSIYNDDKTEKNLDKTNDKNDETERKINNLVISIADDGAGIPAEIKERLFTPYMTTKGSKGTGLGLALSHRIVAEHGGSIVVRDHDPRGAVFLVYLPLTDSPKNLPEILDTPADPTEKKEQDPPSSPPQTTTPTTTPATPTTPTTTSHQ